MPATQNLVARFSRAAAISASVSLSESSIVWGSKSEAADDCDAAIDSIPDDDWSFPSSMHDQEDLYQKAPLAPDNAYNRLMLGVRLIRVVR